MLVSIAPSKHRVVARTVLLVGCTPLALLLALAVPRSETVAVVGAPNATVRQMLDLVVLAGGAPVRSGGMTNVVVATSAAPNFVGRLYRAGAWLVLDPILTAGCTVLPE